jgi:membrane protease YdiL (CAAX protease family)
VPPLAAVLIAIITPPLRPAVLLLVLAGFLVLRRRRSGDAWAWAATVPLATILCWSLVPAPTGLPGGTSCTDPLSPPAAWRLTEMALVLVVVALLVRWLRAGSAHLPTRRPETAFVGLAVAAGFLIAPVALLVGEDAARPFFGTIRLQIGLAGALVPALLFAISNSVLEETTYRGALLSWTERHLGTTMAILVQAAAFGLAHMGSDFIGSPAPVLLSMFVLGAIAGLFVKHTGSLLVPIVIHTAFDVPLYYHLACRLG